MNLLENSNSNLTLNCSFENLVFYHKGLIMKINILFLCLVIYAFSFIANCSPLVSGASGEVFIVTRGGESIKLGLVEICVISESAIKPYIQSKYQSARKEIMPGKPSLGLMKKKLDELEFETEKQKYQSDKITYLESKLKLLNCRIEYDSLLDNMFQYFRDVFSRKGLSTTMLTTKTDADGKFTLSLKPGKYALVASSSRMAGGETEEYHWLIRITVKPNQQTKITLSNDNLFEVNGKENLINLNELPD
jgi:hypothetical protein